MPLTCQNQIPSIHKSLVVTHSDVSPVTVMSQRACETATAWILSEDPQIATSSIVHLQIEQCLTPMLGGVSEVATETCVCAGLVDREQEEHIMSTLLHVYYDSHALYIQVVRTGVERYGWS